MTKESPTLPRIRAVLKQAAAVGAALDVAEVAERIGTADGTARVGLTHLVESGEAVRIRHGRSWLYRWATR